MGFFRKIGSVFGFGEESIATYNESDEDEDVVVNGRVINRDEDSATTEQEPVKPLIESSISPVEQQSEKLPEPTFGNYGEASTDIDVPTETVEAVITMLNASLPEYARQCIDRKAQTEFVMNNIGGSIKTFAESVRNATRAELRAEVERVSAEADKQVNLANQQADEAKQRVAEVQEKLQVTELQRRALNEKATKLEEKVARCEADVEQYQLENKGLLNKLKVNQIKCDDVDYFKNENDRLTAELNAAKVELIKLKNAPAAQTENSEAISAELAEAKKTAEDAAEKLKTSEQQVRELQERETQNTDELRNLREENESLRKEKEDSEHKNKQLSEASGAFQKELEDAQEQIKTLTEEKKQLDDKLAHAANNSDSDELRGKLQLASNQIEALSAELDETKQQLEMANELENRLDEFENDIKANNEKTKNLENQLQQRDKRIEELNNLVNSRDNEKMVLFEETQKLKQDIRANEARFSLKIKDIQQSYERKIEELTKQIASNSIGEPAEQPQQQPNDAVDISWLDDSILSLGEDTKPSKKSPKPQSKESEMIIEDEIAPAVETVADSAVQAPAEPSAEIEFVQDNTIDDVLGNNQEDPFGIIEEEQPKQQIQETPKTEQPTKVAKAKPEPKEGPRELSLF